METIQVTQETKPRSKAVLWTGRVISILCILFLLVDGLMKVARATVSVKGTTSLGFADNLVQPIGFVVLICTVLYIIPRTAVFGALLLTAHLGGAAAIFIMKFNGHPIFFFPVVFCVLVWAGIFLRDEKLRAIVPLKHKD